MINQHGAIDGEGVVEARRVDEPVRLLDVAEKQGAHRRQRHADAIQIIVLTANIGAHADDVAFVGGDDAEAVPLEETAELRIALAFFRRRTSTEKATCWPSSKPNDINMCAMAQPSQYDMIMSTEIELVEIVAAGFPALRVVAVAAPIEIADILQRYAVALDAAMGDLRDIVRPEPIVGGRDALPPDQQRQRRQRRSSERRAPARPCQSAISTPSAECDSTAGRRSRFECPAARCLIPERQRAPDRRNAEQQSGEQHGGESQNILRYRRSSFAHCASNVRRAVHRLIDMHRRRKVRFRVTQSTAFRLNVPFIKELGVEFISAADGRSVVALNLEPWHLNSWSVAHGGVIMSLLDVAMAVAGDRSMRTRAAA